MLRLQCAAIFMIPVFLINCLFDPELRAGVRKTATALTFCKMAVMGFFNNVIPFVLVGIAEVTLNTGVVSILDSTIPLFGIIFAHFFLGVRFYSNNNGGFFLTLHFFFLIRVTNVSLLKSLLV